MTDGEMMTDEMMTEDEMTDEMMTEEEMIGEMTTEEEIKEAAHQAVLDLVHLWSVVEIEVVVVMVVVMENGGVCMIDHLTNLVVVHLHQPQPQPPPHQQQHPHQQLNPLADHLINNTQGAVVVVEDHRQRQTKKEPQSLLK